jgi:hypothetical protein
VGRRGAIEQAGLALAAIARGPFLGGALAHLGGRGRLGERPTLLDDAMGQQTPPFQTERRVSVELHPVSSLD